jgi:outer membrane lipopolysaccharide assembly protein LptE/RlpB
MIKQSKVMVLCGLGLVLTGCGYHLRSSTQWPEKLTHLNFKASGIPADAQISLKLFLKSMRVHFGTTAPYSFEVSNYQYTQTQPTSSNSNVPSTITFSVNETIAITNKYGKSCIAPFSVSSTFSELEQQTNVVVSSVDPDIRERLLENINQSVFEKLTSHDILSQLNSSQCSPNTKDK